MSDDWTQEEIDEAFRATGGTPKPKSDSPHPGGRPSDYDKIDLTLVEKYAKAGLSNEQIAQLLEIAPSTLYLYQKRHPEFSEALKAGKEIADDRVVRALYERATGYECPEDKIFYDSQAGKVVVQETVKHYPPDTAAAFIWLKNRRPNEWKDKVEQTDPERNEIAKQALKMGKFTLEV